MNIRWTWSERKNTLNLAKHKVPFEFAQRVFDDPLHITDSDPYEGEERWRTYGTVQGVLMVVVHTEPVEAGEGGVAIGRIISARKALTHERRLVEQQIYGN